MTMMIAPVGTSPQDRDKWTTVGTTDTVSLSITAEPDTTFEFSGGYRTTRFGERRRAVSIEFADGRRMFIPNADVRIEAGNPLTVEDGWKPLGFTVPKSDRKTNFHKPSLSTSVQKLDPSPAIHGGLPWRELYAMPQRWIAGLPTTTQEPSLSQTFTNYAGASITVDNNGIYPMISTNTNGGRFSVLRDSDLPKFILALFGGSAKLRRQVDKFTQDGKPSFKAGDGGTAGIVYSPTTEDQAQRNLNFALANLAAYNEWETTGREEAKKREENLRAAEKRAKEEREAREAALKAAAIKADAERTALREKARKLYNAANGLNAATAWPLFMGAIAKQKWIDLAKQAEALPKAPTYDQILGNAYASPYASGGIRPSYYNDPLRRAFL